MFGQGKIQYEIMFEMLSPNRDSNQYLVTAVDPSSSKSTLETARLPGTPHSISKYRRSEFFDIFFHYKLS